MVAAKVGEMAAVEPNLDKTELTKVTARTLVMFADDDLMTLQHRRDVTGATQCRTGQR